MKKITILSAKATLLLSFFLIACHKKADTGVNSPGFGQIVGTGGNPVTGSGVTGDSTSTNPATHNTSLNVGGIGWSNPSCSNTTPFTLKGINGSIEVTLTFPGIPSSGNYPISSVASSQACTMVVKNAPNQPIGVIWHAKNGSVAVTTNSTSSSINVSFSGITCTQANFNIPTVILTGVLGCN